MALSNLDPTDNFLQVEAKLDAVIDELNNNRFMKYAVVNIGDWDMDADQFKIVTHGIADYKKIRTVEAIIRDDSDVSYNNINVGSPTGIAGGGVNTITSTSVYLGRVTGGIFDAATYDSTSYNRGYVTIGYVE